MANQVYIIPRRNDLDGMNIQVYDLQPNTSLKNSIYDGAGQSGYVKWSLDAPGLTQVVGNSFNGGSTNTAPIVALTTQQTTVAPPDDVSATAVAEFGLAAYLDERVEDSALTSLGVVVAGAAALAIKALVDAGGVLTLAAIDAAIVGAGATAGTGLTTGNSFGSVEEVIRILQGQVYQVKAHTIIADALGAFLPLGGLGGRADLVANQANPAVTFFAMGGFIARGEPGFRDYLPLVRTGAFLGSAGEGVLFHLKQNMTWKNPNFAYTAAEVTSWRPRAVSINGTVIPETGVWPAIACYDNQGNLL